MKSLPLRLAIALRPPAPIPRRSGAGTACPPAAQARVPGHISGALRILVADQRILARRQLRRHLAELQAIAGVAEASSLSAALAAIEGQRPHVLFLDAELPGGARLDLVRLLRTRRLPRVIVTSADDATIASFQARGCDCLRKPAARDTLLDVLERAHAQMDCAARAADGSEGHERGGLSGKLVVRSSGRVLAVPLQQIEWIEAEDNYVRLHLSGLTHIVRTTLASVEARLDNGGFVRLHRGAMANTGAIEELRSVRGRWLVQLGSGAVLPVGRRYRPRLRQILGL